MTARSEQEILQDIEQALDGIRGSIALHQGGVDVVSFNPQSGLLHVRMKGMCVGCPMSELTLKAGIEETVRMFVPEVTEVVNAEAEGEPDACAHHPS